QLAPPWILENPASQCPRRGGDRVCALARTGHSSRRQSSGEGRAAGGFEADLRGPARAARGDGGGSANGGAREREAERAPVLRAGARRLPPDASPEVGRRGRGGRRPLRLSRIDELSVVLLCGGSHFRGLG